MLEYYEPYLNLSSPEHSNTMGVILSLHDPVDGEILRSVAEELRVRFPYFYVKVACRNNEVITVPNPLPMTVRNSWDSINFNSEDSNYHLATWKYDDRRVAFEIPHSLTDGAGVLPYIKSAMFLYLSKATGQRFNPAGFRLPGDVIPDSEIGDPFRDIDFDSVKSPLYKKELIPDFFRLVSGMDRDKRVFYLKLSESQVMEFCKKNDASLNVLFCVMLAKAARKYDPVCEKTITVSVAINHKAILGNLDNYRMFVGQAILDFPKNRDLDDIRKACTIGRGQLMLQADPENSVWDIKNRKSRLQSISFDVPQASICVSYVNDRSFGPLDPYIEEMYIVTSLSKITDMLCEVTCINHSFFLAFLQPFFSEKFLECFLEELHVVGIPCELLRSEPLQMCGIDRIPVPQSYGDETYL